MKKIFLLIFSAWIAVWVFVGCGHERVETWSDKASIWFTSSDMTDSTKFTFALYPSTLQDTIIGLPISMCGSIESRDREIEVEVIGKPSHPATRYEIIHPVVIPADSTYGILRVKVFRTANLDTERDSVAFRLNVSADLDVSFTEHRTHWLFISNLYEQPEWWSIGSNAWYYLGEYNKVKIQIINMVFGSTDNPMGGDLAQMNVNKYKLEQYINAHQPTYEDGTLVTFPFMEN